MISCGVFVADYAVSFNNNKYMSLGNKGDDFAVTLKYKMTKCKAMPNSRI